MNPQDRDGYNPGYPGRRDDEDDYDGAPSPRRRDKPSVIFCKLSTCIHHTDDFDCARCQNSLICCGPNCKLNCHKARGCPPSHYTLLETEAVYDRRYMV